MYLQMYQNKSGAWPSRVYRRRPDSPGQYSKGRETKTGNGTYLSLILANGNKLQTNGKWSPFPLNLDHFIPGKKHIVYMV